LTLAAGVLMGYHGTAIHAAAAASPDFEALIAAPDRSDADRQTDKRRNPVKLLAVTGVEAGMTVLDVGAGGGYSTELMARAVGPSGRVYGQNTRERENFVERLKKPAMKNVVPLVRPFDDPVPSEVQAVDLITFFFIYHDVTFMEVDRAAMNRKLFQALKPGGFLIIADHSAKPGDGTTVGKSLHRIEEAALLKEVEAAGFVLVASDDFLRNPEDKRDVTVFKSPVPVDEFVLKFQKPR
jgi:predicted methyltransferase